MGTVMFKLEQSLNLDLVCDVFKGAVSLSSSFQQVQKSESPSLPLDTLFWEVRGK